MQCMIHTHTHTRHTLSGLFCPGVEMDRSALTSSVSMISNLLLMSMCRERTVANAGWEEVSGPGIDTDNNNNNNNSIAANARLQNEPPELFWVAPHNLPNTQATLEHPTNKHVHAALIGRSPRKGKLSAWQGCCRRQVSNLFKLTCAGDVHAAAGPNQSNQWDP